MAEASEWLMRLKGRWREDARRLSRRAIEVAPRFFGIHRAKALISRAGRVVHPTVTSGGGGFLFHRDDDVFDQLAGRLVLSPSQLQTWLDALEARRDWCSRNGAAMRFMVAPEKHVVYRDVLPRGVRISPRRPAIRLLEALGGKTQSLALYPETELRRARELMPTYFRTDTHWTDYGAFVAYRVLVDDLARDIALPSLSEPALLWKAAPFVGDLGVRFEPERSETCFTAAYPWDHEVVYQNNNFHRGAVHVYRNPRKDLPTCVLFRDSFANFMIPYLMHSFSRLVAVSSLSCHYDLLQREKPDVVLFMVIERFLASYRAGPAIELPRDHEREAFAAFSGTSLEDFAARPA